MSHDVFLSYSSADKVTAHAVVAGLEEHGVRCWMAPRDIPAGAEYGQEILDAVKGCRICVVIFSEGANTSPHVRREVERAVSAQKHIVPFRVQDLEPTGAMEYALGNTHWLDAFSGPLEGHIATLLATTRRLLGASARGAPTPAPKAITDRPSVVVLPFNNMSGMRAGILQRRHRRTSSRISKVSAFVVARNTASPTRKGRQGAGREHRAGVAFVLGGVRGGPGCASRRS